jgi:hypothetical protein
MPKYLDDSGALVLHFGHGDIAVNTGRRGENREDEVVFVLGEPGEIGRPASLHGQSTADLNIAVRMIFDNVEALDVVLETLQDLRAKMIAPHGD